MKIGVWGGKGSFTEEAALGYANKKDIAPIQVVHFDSIDLLCAAVEKNKIGLGIFPTKNTIGGPVREALEANAYSLTLKDEYEMHIIQCLLVFPGTTIEDIQEIVSHYQPFRQCSEYIAQHFPGMPLKEVVDMSHSADELAHSKLPLSTAIIASKRVAQAYGLEILAEGIQNTDFNVTTFSVVSSK